jgi:hypothetical protein
MFCTACGTAIPAGQTTCPQCGQPMAQASPAFPPPLPARSLEVEQYRNHLRVLAIAWFVYAGLSLLLGLVRLNFARMWIGDFGPRMHGYIPPAFGPMIVHFAWISIVIRSGLALIAGWALLEQATWGRIFAIVIAILSLFHPLLGTALGIWTLVMMLGYRHAVLYEQL